MAAVGNCSEKTPFAPMVADCLTPLMVIETVSPLAGNWVPLPTMPPRVIEVVPTGMDCDGVRPLKETVMGCTAILPMERVCWVPTVRVVELSAVPAEEEALCTWTERLVLGLRVPNEQVRTWLPSAPAIPQVPGPGYAGLMDQFTFVPPGSALLRETLFAVA